MKFIKRKHKGYKALHHERDIGLNPAEDEDGKGNVTFLGYKVIKNDEQKVQGKPEPWKYCIIFPVLLHTETLSMDYQNVISHEEIQKKLALFFRPCIIENEDGEFDYLQLQETFDGNMTKLDFHEAVRWVLACLMAGQHMGFTLQADVSIDGDELFLKVRLDRNTTSSVMGSIYNTVTGSNKFTNTQQLADAVNLRKQLNPDMYPKDTQCPTRELGEDRLFDGTDYVPAALQFSKERRKYFQPFTDLDMIRLISMRLSQFVNFDHLMSENVVKPGGFFAVHRWRRTSMFNKAPREVEEHIVEYPHGWSRLCAFAQWPGEQHLHYVKEYFGEEIGFFYHWLNYFTRILLVPAIIGLGIFIVRMFSKFENEETRTYVDVGFMSLMVLWSTSFLEIYKRQQAYYIEAWGMRDWQVQEVQRSSFEQRLVGSCREEIRQTLHWFGIVVVVVWTICSNYYISKFRAHMLRNPDSTFMFGLEGSVLEKVAKYLVTINITVVDSIWGIVSPKMSKAENHRTPVELKDAMVLKLIVVKVFVYYYPFWYIAFVQEHIEGCNIGGTTCQEYLEQSLIVFVALHIIWVIGAAAISMLFSKRAIKAELKHAENQKGGKNDPEYYYLEAQAKMASYGPEVAIADYLELITSLGLVMQFSIILPLIPLLQLLSNMVEIRFSAYKMINVFKRVEGRGSEGIGSWEKSIYAITWLALIVNVALGVFFMKPMKDWPRDKQVLTFVLVEHALIIAKVLVEAVIPDVSILTHMVRITNSSVIEKIFSGDKGSKVRVEGPRKVPTMFLKWDHETCQLESTITEKGLRPADGVEPPLHTIPHIDKFPSLQSKKHVQEWKACYQRFGRNNSQASFGSEA